MPTTLRELAYEFISSNVESGRYPPGACLSESSIAENLNTSRGPVREAITRLVSEGVVEQVLGSGSYVRIPTRKELEDMYQMREWLECAAVGEVAAHLSAEALSEIDAHHARMHALADQVKGSDSRADEDASYGQFRAVDMGFHRVLLQATGNDELMKAIGKLRLLTRIFGTYKGDPDETVVQAVVRTVREHDRLIECLRRRDSAAAEEEMRRHVRSAKQEALSRFDWEQRQRGASAERLALRSPDLARHLDRRERYRRRSVGNATGRVQDTQVGGSRE
jgi:DNA-binding GntR family transcriptional regulator